MHKEGELPLADLIASLPPVMLATQPEAGEGSVGGEAKDEAEEKTKPEVSRKRKTRFVLPAGDERGAFRYPVLECVCVCVCGFCRSRAVVEAVSRVGGEGGGEEGRERGGEEGRERGEEEDAEYKVGSEPDEDETTIGEQEMFERQAAGSVDHADELDELNRESRFLSSLLPPSSSLLPLPSLLPLSSLLPPPSSLLPPSLTSSLSPFVPPFPFLSPSLPSP